MVYGGKCEMLLRAVENVERSGVKWKICNALKAENHIHNEKCGMYQCKKPAVFWIAGGIYAVHR